MNRTKQLIAITAFAILTACGGARNTPDIVPTSADSTVQRVAMTLHVTKSQPRIADTNVRIVQTIPANTKSIEVLAYRGKLTLPVSGSLFSPPPASVAASTVCADFPADKTSLELTVNVPIGDATVVINAKSVTCDDHANGQNILSQAAGTGTAVASGGDLAQTFFNKSSGSPISLTPPSPQAPMTATQDPAVAEALSDAEADALKSEAPLPESLLAKFAKIVPLPAPPPVSAIAFYGTISDQSDSQIRVHVANPMNQNDGNTAVSTNMQLPDSVTVNISADTVIDSRNGRADLAVGTPIIVGGALNGSNMNALSITPLAANTIRPVSQVAGKSRGSAGSRSVAASSAAQPRSLRAENSSELIADFTAKPTKPIQLYELAQTHELGPCTSLVTKIIASNGFGITEEWPIAISATSNDPLIALQSGAVTMRATGIRSLPPNANFKLAYGVAFLHEDKLVSTCLKQSFTLPTSLTLSKGIAVTAALPAPLGGPDIVLDSNSNDPNIIVACFNVASIGFEKINVIGYSLCPKVVLRDGRVSLGTVGAGNANIDLPPGDLAPASLLSLTPYLAAAASIESNGIRYQYSYNAELELAVSVAGQGPYKAFTVGSASDKVSLPNVNKTEYLSWQLPVTFPTVLPTPASTPAPDLALVNVGITQTHARADTSIIDQSFEIDGDFRSLNLKDNDLAINIGMFPEIAYSFPCEITELAARSVTCQVTDQGDHGRFYSPKGQKTRLQLSLLPHGVGHIANYEYPLQFNSLGFANLSQVIPNVSKL